MTPHTFSTGGYANRLDALESGCGMGWPQSRDEAWDGLCGVDPLDAPETLPGGSHVGDFLYYDGSQHVGASYVWRK